MDNIAEAIAELIADKAAVSLEILNFLSTMPAVPAFMRWCGSAAFKVLGDGQSAELDTGHSLCAAASCSIY